MILNKKAAGAGWVWLRLQDHWDKEVSNMLSNEAAAKRLAWWMLISALGAIFTLGEAQRTVLRAYLGIKVFLFTPNWPLQEFS